jgi:hypothetical protein
MPDIAGTSRAQTLFLRSFRKSPYGPPQDQWPTPAVLRRWLRKPAFRNALQSLREVLRFQIDFDLASAAAQAARRLTHPTPGADLTHQDVKRLSDLLRLAHLRQRFPAEPKLDSPATFSLRKEIEELEERIETVAQDRESFLNYEKDEKEWKEISDDPQKDRQDTLNSYDRDLQQLRDQITRLKSGSQPPQTTPSTADFS